MNKLDMRLYMRSDWREFMPTARHAVINIRSCRLIRRVEHDWTLDGIEIPSECCFLLDITYAPWIIYDCYKWAILSYDQTIEIPVQPGLTISDKTIIDQYIAQNIGDI